MTQPKTEIEVVYVSLPKGIGGLYDHQTRTIFIERTLRSGSKRATEEHERIHAERGDTRCDDPWFHKKQELVVERETARRLIPVKRLAEGLVWCRDHHELAEFLDVDGRLVRARYGTLTDQERAYIERRISSLEVGH